MDEYIGHLFFTYPFSHSVWDIIPAWVGLRRSMSTLHNTMKWIKRESRDTSWHSKAKRKDFWWPYSTCWYYCSTDQNICIQSYVFFVSKCLDSIWVLSYGSLDCFDCSSSLYFVLPGNARYTCISTWLWFGFPGLPNVFVYDFD